VQSGADPTRDPRSQLSPGAAVLIGIALAGFGVFCFLLATGVIGQSPSGGGATPAWVGICAGLVFLCGGGAIVVGYAIAGGVAPDGDLPAGTPFRVRLTQYVLGITMGSALAAIGSWVAFGRGPRHFTMSGPFGSGPGNEIMGRVVFGIGAVLAWGIVALLAVFGLRRLRQRP
jgi:hypothetical protein